MTLLNQTKKLTSQVEALINRQTQMEQVILTQVQRIEHVVAGISHIGQQVQNWDNTTHFHRIWDEN